MKLRRSQQRIAETTALVFLALYFCCFALPRAWHTLNTDFPNYHVAARLVRTGVDSARAYEWLWIERAKDHWSIDQRLVGLVPITPFSALVMLPLAAIDPLPAKHIWIVINLLLMAVLALQLSKVSGLSILQSLLLIGLSYPLQKNLLFGQYYILLLVLLTAGCLAAQRGRSGIAGAFVALSAALKIFPILLILYFLRKRDWKATIFCLLTLVACSCLSVRVFGTGLHRTYLQQVLPWTLRGDCLPPFNLASGSLSSLLHCLFVYEPQWNPHPAFNAPWLMAVSHPILQMALLAPAVLWIDPDDKRPQRIALEWSGLLLVALTISTLTASYHFTVLLFPMAVLSGYFLRRQKYSFLLSIIALFIAIGYPGWHISQRDGWAALLCVPRLYLLFALSLTMFWALRTKMTRPLTLELYLWIGGLAITALASISLGLHHQQGLFDDFAYRLPMPTDVLLASQPVAYGQNEVAFIALTKSGYREADINRPFSSNASELIGQDMDQLSLAVSGKDIWTEQVSSHSVLHLSGSSNANIDDAESPALSPTGKTMAFLRQVGGRKEAFIHSFQGYDLADRQLTRSLWNVSEMAFLSEDALVISATHDRSQPGLYLLTFDGKITSIEAGIARYPSISRDGRRLAFSRLVDGNWNLFLRNLQDGTTARLTTAPCNQIESSWEADSKTLLYATDCGRALWFTALARRKVIP